MRYVVCDDDEVFAEYLAEKIKEIEPECDIKTVNSASALIFNMEDIGHDTDAVFMDISLKDGNGISIAISLVNKYPSLKIIYVTGYGSRYSQAIFGCPPGLEPLAYIVKPVKERYLRNALSKIHKTDKRYENIVLKSDGEVVIINPKDLISVSSLSRKLIFHTAKENFEIYGKLSSYLDRLPDCFIRTGKSHVINITHISRIRDWKTIIMSDDSEYPLGRTYCNQLKQFLAINKKDLRKD